MILLAAALSIAQQLAKQQHTDAYDSFTKPEYVVFDRWPNHKPRTIFAQLVDINREAEIVAFHVTLAGVIQRLAVYQDIIHGMELKDVTGDGRPELLVTGDYGNRSVAIEILEWTGRKFKQIGETSDHAAFVDIDGDGVPEILEQVTSETNECDGQTGELSIQKLKHGRFEDDPHPRLVSVDEVTTNQRLDWAVRDSLSTKCRLRVINKGAKTITLTLRDEDGDADDPIVVHEGTQPIELPSRCTTADVRIIGPRGAKVLFLLESQ